VFTAKRLPQARSGCRALAEMRQPGAALAVASVSRNALTARAQSRQKMPKPVDLSVLRLRPPNDLMRTCRCQRESGSGAPFRCSSSTRAALPTWGDSGSGHPLRSPHRPSLAVHARAGERGAPWLPPHRSHRATLEDGAGCICSPTGRRSGNIPSRWAPGSFSSKFPQGPGSEQVVMGRAAHFRTRGVKPPLGLPKDGRGVAVR
jgi:hypothetical protein